MRGKSLGKYVQKFIKSIKSVKPVKPIKSVKPVKSIKSVKSVKLVKSVKSIKSVKSVKSIKSVKSVKFVKPIKSVKFVKPIKHIKVYKGRNVRKGMDLPAAGERGKQEKGRSIRPGPFLFQLGEPYFICSSCFLIIRRTISPPMEPASREVRSPL